MSFLRIHPLDVGTISRPLATFCYGAKPGEVIEAPLISWFIDGSSKKILVDTGGGDVSRAHPRWQPYTRRSEQSIENALRNIGVACEDIDIVVITHLHWDHCGGTGLFPKAKVVVQQEELVAARQPFPITEHTYNKAMIEEINYTVISGDNEIAEGVSVILTPGHTYGLQGVLVEAENHRYFIAADTFGLYRNIETDSPLISGIYVDLKKYYDSLNRIRSLSALILPGHDPRVFDAGKLV